MPPAIQKGKFYNALPKQKLLFWKSPQEEADRRRIKFVEYYNIKKKSKRMMLVIMSEGNPALQELKRIKWVSQNSSTCTKSDVGF